MPPCLPNHQRAALAAASDDALLELPVDGSARRRSVHDAWVAATMRLATLRQLDADAGDDGVDAWIEGIALQIRPASRRGAATLVRPSRWVTLNVAAVGAELRFRWVAPVARAQVRNRPWRGELAAMRALARRSAAQRWRA